MGKPRLRLAVLLAASASVASAATIVVNDSSDALHSPGCATTGAGTCTLRDAITFSNSNPGFDTITFNIAGAGVHTIAPTTPLPPLTGAATIDGYSQPGSSQNTNDTGGLNTVLTIELNLAGTGGAPLEITQSAGGSIVRGLVINRSLGGAIAFDPLSNGNVVLGCFIGTNPAGTAASPNGDGIVIGSANNTVGSSNAFSRNLISGQQNAGISFGAVLGENNNVIQGNLIGTDVTGTSALPNTNGISVINSNATNNLIGGTTPAERNVISGNVSTGVFLGDNTLAVRSPGTIVRGNYIGTDVTGALAIPNGVAAVFVTDQNRGNTIGGTAAGAGNLLSGNGQYGVFLGTSQNVVQGNRIGTNAAGTAAITGQVAGISVAGGNDNTIGGTSAGAGNLIAFSSGPGVALGFGPPTGIAILGNSIHDNAFQGIALNGGNNGQPAPVITAALIVGGNVTISGTLQAAPSTTYRVEIFSTPPVCDPVFGGQGKTFLGFTNATTGAGGSASFGPLMFAIPAGETVITATATDPANDTSEFSGCFTAFFPQQTFFTVAPCRVVDTRRLPGLNGGPALAANEDRTFLFGGQCGLPANVRTVAINIAVTQSSAGGDLRLFPAGTALPLVSAINYNAGQTRANNAIIPLGVSSDLTVHVDQPAGTVDVILDVFGYFQ